MTIPSLGVPRYPGTVNHAELEASPPVHTDGLSHHVLRSSRVGHVVLKPWHLAAQLALQLLRLRAQPVCGFVLELRVLHEEGQLHKRMHVQAHVHRTRVRQSD